MAERTEAQKTGRMGENAASAYLERKGFGTVRRNYHSRYGEIDIIAENDKYTLFVEVKTRSVRALASPSAFVDRSKQEKLIKTAILYMRENSGCRMPRFDVVEVVYDDITRSVVSIKHIESAFTLSDSEYSYFG